jgi:hypothetical protein
MTMWDSTTPGAIPVGVPIVAGYIDGRFAWTPAQWARLGSSYPVTITVFGFPGARVADCERGDLTPTTAAIWATTEVWLGRRPTIYSSRSTWPQVTQQLALRGTHTWQVDWWCADPTGTPHLYPGSVATQYAWNQLGQTGGVNADWSTTNGVWPATIPVVALGKPTIVGTAVAPQGGYWQAAADGGVFTFGPANFHGSMGGQVLSAPIIDITASGDGYYLTGSDGAIYAFNAPYYGGRNQ